MIFTINNWSNGGTGWTHGPPAGEDSNLRGMFPFFDTLPFLRLNADEDH